MIETPSVSSGAVTDGDLAALTPDPQNARLHSAENLDLIQASLTELGAGRSILIDENDVILAGNGVAQAAQQAGMTRVMVVEADGDALIAVRRRGLTPEQKTRLALFDNRASDLSSFDPLMLAGLQAEGVSLDGLWTGDELDALLADLPELADVGGLLPHEPRILSQEPPEHSENDGIRALQSSTGAVTDSNPAVEMQRSEVSPRPPSADTDPYKPPPQEAQAAQPPAAVAGLDRVTPGQETSRAGLFLHFRGLKIPLSAEEGAALDVRLAQHRETAGTYYGFIDSLLAFPHAGLEEEAA